jgi:5-formyltetrahydrofolate cyclo-ligase
MDIPSLSLQEKKRLMRLEMRAIRKFSADERVMNSNKLRDVFRAHIQLPPNTIVSSYNAFRDEMDPAPLCEALRDLGHKIALPIIGKKRTPLSFQLYEKGDKLEANAMGILQPVQGEGSPSIDPDIVLVPLLAFDRNHHRLGYGGGYYDRTIESLRARKSTLAIGIAYACQEVKDVPIGDHDLKLDKIVTELNIF